MDRRRAEELLSDYREGSLDAVLRGELEAYLARDEECRRLLAALGEVAEALPRIEVPEPPAGLARRAAAAALATRRPRAVAVPFRPALPALLQAAAAVAMLATGLAGLLWGPEAGPARAASRLVERTGLELREQKDRLVENLRLLQVVVGTAFESRLERIEERVDDYRELLEERHDPAEDEAPLEGRVPGPQSALSARGEGVELAAPGLRFIDWRTDARQSAAEPKRRWRS